MGAIVSVSSPPLALTNMIVSAFAAIVLAELAADRRRGGRPVAGAGRLQRRRRTQASSPPAASGSTLDARRARRCNFVDEFENSGRGWFWETNSAAPCPTSRSSSPTISSASPRSCSAASSPICCRSTPARPTVARGAQDAGLPPVGPLPLLRRRRPRRQRRGHSLVAVGQPDLRRARPLPRLPRHRHRPHRAAPLRAGDHPARAVRFADRPAQPGADAPDARRGAAQRRPAARRAARCS